MLRDDGTLRQLGLHPSEDFGRESMVDAFNEVLKKLKDDAPSFQMFSRILIEINAESITVGYAPPVFDMPSLVEWDDMCEALELRPGGLDE